MPSLPAPEIVNERAVIELLDLPADWVVSADGRQAAQVADDLGTQQPTGLRVTVDGGDEPAMPEEPAETRGISIVQNPAAYTVFGSAPAVSMALEFGVDQGLFTERHTVAYLDGAAYLITFDGPSSADFALLERALGLELR